MTSIQDVITRVAAVIGVIQSTVWALAGAAAGGALAMVVAIGLVGHWESSGVVLAAVIGAMTLYVAFVLARFAAAIGPIRRLPEVSAAELKLAAGTLRASLWDGERRFVEARGLGRVVTLGQALWGLRADVKQLTEGHLAPAAALGEAMVPTRLVRVGISALAAPFLLTIGLMSLLAALVVA